jgi:hypothetical protein
LFFDIIKNRRKYHETQKNQQKAGVKEKHHFQPGQQWHELGLWRCGNICENGVFYRMCNRLFSMPYDEALTVPYLVLKLSSEFMGSLKGLPTHYFLHSF